MKLSARNQLKGTITEINEGAVNAIVKIDIGGGNVISSTISMAAVKELGLTSYFYKDFAQRVLAQEKKN